MVVNIFAHRSIQIMGDTPSDSDSNNSSQTTDSEDDGDLDDKEEEHEFPVAVLENILEKREDKNKKISEERCAYFQFVWYTYCLQLFF